MVVRAETHGCGIAAHDVVTTSRWEVSRLLQVTGAEESCDGYMRSAVCLEELNCGWKRCVTTEMRCPSSNPCTESVIHTILVQLVIGKEID